MAVATGNENHPDQEAHQQKAQVSESRKLRKHRPLTTCSWFDVAGTRPVAENPDVLRKGYMPLKTRALLRLAVDLGPPPSNADKQKAPIVEKFRRFAFEGVADKLEHPSEEKQSRGIAP